MRFFKTFFGEYGLIFMLALGLGAFYCVLFVSNIWVKVAAVIILIWVLIAGENQKRNKKSS